MAGSIVKWWKHKFLGGYKQFSALQDCATDCEENVAPNRAPSSCSAPPDLLLVNDKDPCQMNAYGNGCRSSRNKEKNLRKHYVRHDEGEKVSSNHSGKGQSELTCDVSVEGDTSSQSLQFSFTFYDLDGHHGKITKDDITGIVYTIYDSIGKSIVVPHYGSKTINVRLTVSPEGEVSSSSNVNKQITPASTSANRQCSYHRTKKYSKSDDEDYEVHESSDNDGFVPMRRGTVAMHRLQKSFGAPTTCGKVCCSEGQVVSCDNSPGVMLHTPVLVNGTMENSEEQVRSKNQDCDNVYESIPNLRFVGKDARKQERFECKAHTSIHHDKVFNDLRGKVLRRSREHKEEHNESRQRSLSVGNEYSWKLRSNQPRVQEPARRSSRNSPECWNSALKRNDLIDIIRESLEKNRLCFQPNGKSRSKENYNRYRQRSHTVSRLANESLESPYNAGIHLQQLTTSPAVQPHKNTNANLCGYDSFLHATICASGKNNSSSPKNYGSPNNLQKSSKPHRNGLQTQQNSPQFQGYQRLSSSDGAHKLNTALLNALNPQITAEEKLNRTICHVEKWLNEKEDKAPDHKSNKHGLGEKLRKDEKNYDNLINARFGEKSTNSPKKINNNLRRMHHTQEKVHTKPVEVSDNIHNENILQPKSKFVTFIPINVDPTECENLIHGTSEEDMLSATSQNDDHKSGEHCSGTAYSNWNNSNSTIHHCVHEHIHHHYHHFEEKED